MEQSFSLDKTELILDKKQQWDYKKSPLLSDYLNEYKLNRPKEFLALPKQMERGNITAKNLTKATTADECIELIKKWANEVYYAWSSNHSLVSQIADEFLDMNNNSKTYERKKQRTANEQFGKSGAEVQNSAFVLLLNSYFSCNEAQ